MPWRRLIARSIVTRSDHPGNRTPAIHSHYPSNTEWSLGGSPGEHQAHEQMSKKLVPNGNRLVIPIQLETHSNGCSWRSSSIQNKSGSQSSQTAVATHTTTSTASSGSSSSRSDKNCVGTVRREWRLETNRWMKQGDRSLEEIWEIVPAQLVHRFMWQIDQVNLTSWSATWTPTAILRSCRKPWKPKQWPLIICTPPKCCFFNHPFFSCEATQS